jgi:hypothetical protein
MDTILDKYTIKFYNKSYVNPKTGKTTLNKIFEVRDPDFSILRIFFEEFQTANEVEEYILDPINEVKNNTVTEGKTGSDSGVAVYIKIDFTKFNDFYGPGTYLDPTLQISTADFEAIAIQWQEFVS